MRHPILTAAAAMLVVSCAGDATPPPAITYRMEIVSGSNQTDTAGAVLAKPLVVRVQESSGSPAATRPVDFVATDGSLSAGSVTTDAAGLAQVSWTLGTNEGIASVRASLRGSGDSALTFLATVRSPTLNAVSVSAGYNHTCAITSSHRLYCWGQNDEGQFGDGTVVSRNFAREVPGTLLFDRLATGRAHTCALTVAGELYCWGRNFWGEIGDGSTTNRLTPIRIAPNLTFAAVVAGGETTCGLTVTGTVYCWGFMLGSQSTNNYRSPADVSGGIRFRSLGAAEQLVCGVGVDDKSYCFAPAKVLDTLFWRPQPAPLPAQTRYAGGSEFMCGLDAAGVAQCWGINSSGQLGNGTTTPVSGAVPVSGGHVFQELYPGYDWICGATTGATYCWGHNTWGAVGPVGGERTIQATPLPLEAPTGLRFVTMDGGLYHMCGVGTDTQVYCWGGGFDGQLGDGRPTANYYNRSTPAPVIRR